MKKLNELQKEKTKIFKMEQKLKKLDKLQYLQTKKLKEELYNNNVNAYKKEKRKHNDTNIIQHNTLKENFVNQKNIQLNNIQKQEYQNKTNKTYIPGVYNVSETNKNNINRPTSPYGITKFLNNIGNKISNVNIGERVIFKKNQTDR